MAISLSAALGFYLRKDNPPRRLALERLRASTAKVTEKGETKIAGRRPIYPYSIIAGGAHSRQELQQAAFRDPVVRKHYAGFHVQNAYLTQAKIDRLMYVSFRKGDQVYWTSKRVRIPQGEPLLTDGTHFARTRCGNRISDRPQPHTTPDEPPNATLDTPEGFGADEANFPFETAQIPVFPLIDDGSYTDTPPEIGGGASEPGTPGHGSSGGFIPFGIPAMLSGFPAGRQSTTPNQPGENPPGNPRNPNLPVPPVGPPIGPPEIPITPTPEPASFGLLAVAGIVGLVGRHLQKRCKH